MRHNKTWSGKRFDQSSAALEVQGSTSNRTATGLSEEGAALGNKKGAA
jgi:hypothetical protein